ncbi:MAG: ATP-binding protein, partial [Spirochaetales bacterium]|nr:ATP-binding protein [Spirochaetales bacterium]
MVIDKEIFRKVELIRINTRHSVTSLFAGEFESAFKGSGLEFEEVREYLPGDEIRSIDWNVTARTGSSCRACNCVLSRSPASNSTSRPLRKENPARRRSWVAITVTDTGRGIPRDVLPRIFEPFYTTKLASKGTGLGLASVQGIVLQSKGLITVDSDEGIGSTFKV